MDVGLISQTWLVVAVLGGCGGAAYELVELARFLRGHGHFPWSPRGRPRVVKRDGALRRYESFPVYLIAVVIRVLVGGVVALGLSLAGSLSPLAALVAGVAGYSVIDRWAETRPVGDGDRAPGVTRAG